MHSIKFCPFRLLKLGADQSLVQARWASHRGRGGSGERWWWENTTQRLGTILPRHTRAFAKCVTSSGHPILIIHEEADMRRQVPVVEKTVIIPGNESTTPRNGTCPRAPSSLLRYSVHHGSIRGCYVWLRPCRRDAHVGVSRYKSLPIGRESHGRIGGKPNLALELQKAPAFMSPRTLSSMNALVYSNAAQEQIPLVFVA